MLSNCTELGIVTSNLLGDETENTCLFFSLKHFVFGPSSSRLLNLQYWTCADMIMQTREQVRACLAKKRDGLDADSSLDIQRQQIEANQTNTLKLCTEKVLLAQQAYDLVIATSSMEVVCISYSQQVSEYCCLGSTLVCCLYKLLAFNRSILLIGNSFRALMFLSISISQCS